MSTPQPDPGGRERIAAVWREMCQAPPSFAELREFFTRLQQQHFSNSADYGSDQEDMACLVFNPADPENSELPVRTAFGEIAISQTRGVRVVLGPMSFKPVSALTNSYSEDNATIFSTTSFTANLRVVVDHDIAEVAQKLAESSAIFTQATRLMWQDLYHLSMFQLSGIESTRKRQVDPEPMHQVIVTFTMQGSLILALTEESLLLKKIDRRIIPIAG